MTSVQLVDNSETEATLRAGAAMGFTSMNDHELGIMWHEQGITFKKAAILMDAIDAELALRDAGGQAPLDDTQTQLAKANAANFCDMTDDELAIKWHEQGITIKRAFIRMDAIDAEFERREAENEEKPIGILEKRR